jgi:hypothetical protein
MAQWGMCELRWAAVPVKYRYQVLAQGIFFEPGDSTSQARTKLARDMEIHGLRNLLPQGNCKASIEVIQQYCAAHNDRSPTDMVIITAKDEVAAAQLLSGIQKIRTEVVRPNLQPTG